jgi:hypothetical protein
MIEIKKAKLTKGRTVILEYSEFSSGVEKRFSGAESTNLYDKDLEGAFKKLVPHLVIICDQKGDSEITDLENCEQPTAGYKVTGFVCGGMEDTAGVTLVGQKIIDGNKVINLVSPFTMFTDDYIYAGELATDIEIAKTEIYEYFFNGKSAVKQGDLFEGVGDDAGVTITTNTSTTTKKKKGKKKDIEPVVNYEVDKDVISPVFEESF